MNFIYKNYLNAFAVVRSGGQVPWANVSGTEDKEICAATLGVTDAKNHACAFPSPKWQVIARVAEMCLDKNPNGQNATD